VCLTCLGDTASQLLTPRRSTVRKREEGADSETRLLKTDGEEIDLVELVVVLPDRTIIVDPGVHFVDQVRAASAAVPGRLAPAEACPDAAGRAHSNLSPVPAQGRQAAAGLSPRPLQLVATQLVRDGARARLAGRRQGR